MDERALRTRGSTVAQGVSVHSPKRYLTRFGHTFTAATLGVLVPALTGCTATHDATPDTSPVVGAATTPGPSNRLHTPTANADAPLLHPPSAASEVATPGRPSDSQTPTAIAEDPFSWQSSTGKLQDDAGYTYQFDVSLHVLGPSSGDVADAAPGFTRWISPPIQVSVVQHNLTAGRNEPTALTTFAVYWRMPADLCAKEDLPNDWIPTIAVTPDGTTVLCPVVGGTAPYVSQNGSVSAGGSLELADGDYSVSDPLWPTVMSEADAAAFADATVRPPQAWALFAVSDAFPSVPGTTYLSTMWNHTMDKYDWHILASKNMPGGVQR